MKLTSGELLSKETVATIAARSAVLLINFLIVVFTTNNWGPGGRGEIALVITNVAIIAILSNITCGTTIAFHAQKEKAELLVLISLAGVLIFSLAGSVIFSLTTGFKYFKDLFIISLLISLNNAISNYWLGRNNIKLYNILMMLNPGLILLFLFVFWNIFRIGTIRACFYSYYAGLGVLLIIGLLTLRPLGPFRLPAVGFRNVLNILKYGTGNELNNFIQFLNYRLSYFFIAKILGLATLGIFSVAVSCAEAVWIASKSMSALNYSGIISSDDRMSAVSSTIGYAKQSFWVSILIMLIAIMIPRSLFEYVFGTGFGVVKIYLIWLIPGIIAMAVSNLYGHYFSGIGKLNIVRNRALLGLSVTVALLFLLTGKYLLKGVCIALDASYMLSSGYLYFKFRREVTA